jgi:hypothetical protein
METVANLRREIEMLSNFNIIISLDSIRKSNSFYANNATSPPTDQSIGLNTKKLYPINCLSCTVNRETPV